MSPIKQTDLLRDLDYLRIDLEHLKSSFRIKIDDIPEVRASDLLYVTIVMDRLLNIVETILKDGKS